MSRLTRVIAVAACSLAVAGCASSIPSLDLTPVFKRAPDVVPVAVQSEPPGAEAKSSAGPSCRTPCSLEATTGTEFSVSFALDGYLPQTVAVQPLPAGSHAFGATPNEPRFRPSPVFAQLEPAPLPNDKKVKRARTGTARPAPAAPGPAQ